MESSDEEDTHQCGRCKEIFCSLESYFEHKKMKNCKKPNRQTPVVRAGSLERTTKVPHDIDPCIDDHGTCSDITSQVSPSTGACTSSVHDVTSVMSVHPCIESQGCSTKPSVPTSSAVQTRSKRKLLPRNSDEQDKSAIHSSDSHTHNDVYEKARRKSDNLLKKCPECHLSFSRTDDYDRHLRVEHNLTTYICSGCVRPFRDQYKLRHHLKVCKRKKQDDIPQYMNFQASNRIYKHDTNTAQDKDGDPEVKNKVNEDSASTQVSNFQCLECEEKFDTFTIIKEHTIQQHEITAAICQFCGRWFTTKYKLWRHIQSSVHDNLSPRQIREVKPTVLKLKVNWRGPRQEPSTNRVLECPWCKMEFNNRRQLIKHTRMEHDMSGGLSEYQCQHCNTTIKGSNKKYRTHLKTVHKVKGKFGVFSCAVCGNHFNQINHLKRHWQTLHHAKPQEPLNSDDRETSIESGHEEAADGNVDSEQNKSCFVCCKSFPNEKSRTVHLMDHRVWRPDHCYEDPINAVGRKCLEQEQHPQQGVSEDTEFSQQANDEETVVEEIVVMDPDEPLTIEVRSVSPIPAPSQVTPTGKGDQWVCSHCSLALRTHQDLYEHKKLTHKLKLVFACVQESCKEEFSDAMQYEVHHLEHNQMAFICAICNDHFSSMSVLAAHKSDCHRKERLRNFVCDVCRRGFETKEQLEQHIKNGTGHFPCDICGKVFRRNADVKEHAHLHRSTRPFLCELCGSGFVSKSSLKIHVAAKHEDARPHKCTQCQDAFRKKEHLLRHMKSKHSSDTPFECDTCGKKFKRGDKLKEHQKVHLTEKPYVCKKCGISYRQREGLRYHEKSHERDKKFPCTVCSVDFPRVGQLKKHLEKSHNIASQDQHVYPCSLCQAKFSRPGRVKRHLEKQHNMEMKWNEICSICQKGFPGQKSLLTHMKQRHSKGKGRVPTIFGTMAVQADGNTSGPSDSGSPNKPRAKKTSRTTAAPQSQKTVFMHLHPMPDVDLAQGDKAKSNLVVSDNNSQLVVNAGFIQGLHNPTLSSSQLALLTLAAPSQSREGQNIINMDTSQQRSHTTAMGPSSKNDLDGPTSTCQPIPVQHIVTSSITPTTEHVQFLQVGTNSQLPCHMITLNPVCVAPNTEDTGAQPPAQTKEPL